MTANNAQSANGVVDMPRPEISLTSSRRQEAPHPARNLPLKRTAVSLQRALTRRNSDVSTYGAVISIVSVHSEK